MGLRIRCIALLLLACPVATAVTDEVYLAHTYSYVSLILLNVFQVALLYGTIRISGCEDFVFYPAHGGKRKREVHTWGWLFLFGFMAPQIVTAVAVMLTLVRGAQLVAASFVGGVLRIQRPRFESAHPMRLLLAGTALLTVLSAEYALLHWMGQS